LLRHFDLGASDTVPVQPPAAARSLPKVDIGAELRAMWA
jgi:hypothetical protein